MASRANCDDDARVNALHSVILHLSFYSITVVPWEKSLSTWQLVPVVHVSTWSRLLVTAVSPSARFTPSRRAFLLFSIAPSLSLTYTYLYYFSRAIPMCLTVSVSMSVTAVPSDTGCHLCVFYLIKC